MYRSLCLILCVVFVSGCGTLEQHPLLYGSTQTLGVAVSAGADTDFTLGFKSNDFAYVPTTVVKEGNAGGYQPVAAIRGCSVPNNSKRQVLDESESDSSSNYLCKEAVYNARQAQPEDDRAALQGANNLSGQQNDDGIGKALPKVVQDSNVSNSNQDALSVFGSFASNSSSGGSSGVGVKLGKIFSAGVAAQKVAESIGAQALAESQVSISANQAAIAEQQAKQSIQTSKEATRKACFDAVSSRTYEDDDKQVAALNACLTIE